MSDLHPARWLRVKHALHCANRGEWTRRNAQRWLDQWCAVIDTEITLNPPRIDAEIDPIIVRFGDAFVLRGDRRLLLALFGESMPQKF
ncbi:MAG TPA: hypothetical protein VGJ20_00120 [Xanthobacteraceae bacterium]